MIVGLLIAAATFSQPIEEPAGIIGTWINPRQSVVIQIAACGQAFCGEVVWASESAQEDARRGGTAQLVGTQVMRSLVVERPGVWTGRIFVPDINRAAKAKLRQERPNELRVTGCRIGGIVCKTQIWTRTEQAKNPLES